MPDLFGNEPYEGLTRSAEISECGKYRWWLARHWKCGGNGKTVTFVMLNPSTAGGLSDDPTIRRCMGYTQAWGYSLLIVRNLFPWRATDPKDLLPLTLNEARGGGRGRRELATSLTADLVLAAWGAHGLPYAGACEFVDLAAALGKPLHCLGVTKDGHPRHPLYCRAGLTPIPFDPRKE